MIENNLSRTENLNTECHIEKLPPEIIYEIFKYLSTIEIVKMSELNKYFYVLTNDPYLLPFRWVLTSSTIRKLEKEKVFPLIEYNHLKEAFIPEESYFAVMNSYVKLNYLKEFESSKNKDLLYLCLDCDPDNEKAKVELLKAYRDSTDDIDQMTGFLFAKKWAKEGFEEAAEILLSAYLNGGFGIDNKDPMRQKEGMKLISKLVERQSLVACKYKLKVIHFGLLGTSTNQDNQKQFVTFAEENALKFYPAAALLLNIYEIGDLNHDPASLNVQSKALRLINQLAKSDNIALKDLAELALARGKEEGLFGLEKKIKGT